MGTCAPSRPPSHPPSRPLLGAPPQHRFLCSLFDAKPWTLGGDCLWDFGSACIYVSVCIDAPEHGQCYCILHLFTLSRVTVYP